MIIYTFMFHCKSALCWSFKVIKLLVMQSWHKHEYIHNVFNVWLVLIIPSVGVSSLEQPGGWEGEKRGGWAGGDTGRRWRETLCQCEASNTGKPRREWRQGRGQNGELRSGTRSGWWLKQLVYLDYGLGKIKDEREVLAGRKVSSLGPGSLVCSSACHRLLSAGASQ